MPSWSVSGIFCVKPDLQFLIDLPEGWAGVPTWLQRPHCPQENTHPNTALTSKPTSSAHSAWLCPAPSLPPRPCCAGCLDRQETGSQEWGCHPPRLAHEPSALVARWAPEQPPPKCWPCGLLSPQAPSSRAGMTSLPGG